MKKLLLIVVAVLFNIGLTAQSQTQQGVSYRYNGKNPRTPLPNVTIECVTASNTVISDQNGSFTLNFSNLKMGDRVGLVTVKKREMMVFNQHAVDEWSIRKEPLCLILCDANEFEQQKKEYMELGRRDAKLKYDRQKEELERQLKEGKIKLEDKEKALNDAYEQLERLQKEIDKYADDLARIDMSELDDKMQEILETYQRGETQEAIEILKSLKLAEEFDKEIAHNEAVQQELQRSDSKLQTLIEQMKSCVTLLKNSGEWEEAGKYLKRIADKTNNYDDVFEYAYYCQSQNDFKEAEIYYQRALTLASQKAEANPQAYEPDVAMTLNNLGILYRYTQRFAESEAAYGEALEIRRRLAEANPQAYEPDVASTLNNLAALYYSTQRLTESESMHLKALEIRRRLAQANPQAYEPDLANSLNNLAALYYSTQRHTESEAMYLEALEIRRRLAQANPQAYEPDVANTLNNLANLFSDTQHYAESESMHLEALEIRRRLAQANPQAYEPDVASTLNNLALLYQDTQRIDESETIYLEALEIYRRLAEDNPLAYEPDVAMTLNNLATLYKDTKHLTESETAYIEALAIRRRLTEGAPQTYKSDMAQTLFNYGLLLIEEERYSEAISAFEEAMPIYQILAQNNSAFESIYTVSLYFLAQLYPMTGEHAKHYAVNEKWLPFMKEWYQEDKENHEEDYIDVLGSQSFQCIFMKRFTQAEQYSKEALTIDPSQHWIYTNLAAALLLQGKYDEAEAIYRQYKDELKESFLGDFNDFEAAGVIPEERKADVERIRKMLNE